jgi:hypothetical protein
LVRAWLQAILNHDVWREHRTRPSAGDIRAARVPNTIDRLPFLNVSKDDADRPDDIGLPADRSIGDPCDQNDYDRKFPTAKTRRILYSIKLRGIAAAA